MIKLIENYFKVNKLHSIYTIIILCIMFMIFRTYIDEVLQNKRLIDYADYLDDNLYVLNIYDYDNIENLHQEFGDAMSYVYSEILEDSSLNESFACYHVNQFYCDNVIKVKKGRLLTYGSNKNEVLLFGTRLQHHYDIGDSVILGGEEYTVVGYISSTGYLLDLFHTGINSESNIEDISTRALNGDMFVTNSCDLSGYKSDGNFVTCNVVIVDRYSDNYKNAVSMKQIKRNTYKFIGQRKRFSILGVAMLLVLLMYSVLSMTVVHSKRCGKLLSIYYINGLSKKGYMLFSILTEVVIIVCANALYIFIYLSNFLNRIFIQSDSMGAWCIYSSLILSAFLIIIDVLFNLFMVKASALEIMRKCE